MSVSILFGLIVIFAMLGGLVWPIGLMPEPLQRLGMLLPTYWLAESLAIVDGPLSPRELAVPLTALTLLTLACLLAGSKRKLG